MAERQTPCPACNSLVQTVTVHDPVPITVFNAPATIKCLDCKHEWRGLVKWEGRVTSRFAQPPKTPPTPSRYDLLMQD